MPTYVSGNKNKMGFCHLSTNCNKKSNVRTEDNLLKNVSSEFLYWFSGFTDASSRRKYSTKKPSTNNELSLVVWGTNLRSQVGTGKFTKLVSSIINLPNYNKSIIIGLLLSDGWLTFASKTNKNARLGFKQTINKASYVWFIFNELSHYCSSYPYYAESKRSGKVLYNLGFFTRGLPCFTELHPLFYLNNVKIVPEDIYNLLTPVALAHLIMGDGGFKSKGIYICTDSYTIQDTVRLMNVLIIRYDFKCTLHKASNQHGYRIYISRNSLDKIKKLVKPHFIPSMYYKLGE